MVEIEFEGTSPEGKSVRGTIHADNEREAKLRLRAQGFESPRILVATKGKEDSALFSRGTRVRAKGLLMFTRKMATLISSGVDVLPSLESLVRESESEELRKICEGLRNSVARGESLYSALQLFPKVFDRFYITVIKAGEERGSLEVSLGVLSVHIEESLKLKNKMAISSWYPVAMITMTILVITSIFAFVIPQFSIFSAQEFSNWRTVVGSLSHFFVEKWLGIVGVVILFNLFLGVWSLTDDGKRQLHTFVLKIPVFGSLVRFGAIVKMIRALETLVASGVSMADSLEVTRGVVGDRKLEKILQQSQESVTRGQSLTLPFNQSEEIPAMVGEMISVGEQTGEVEEMFHKLANFYEREIDSRMAVITGFVEPVLMVVLGVFITVLVVVV